VLLIREEQNYQRLREWKKLSHFLLFFSPGERKES